MRHPRPRPPQFQGEHSHADLRDLTNRGRVTVDIDAEPTRSSLPQRKAHKHIQLH